MYIEAAGSKEQARPAQALRLYGLLDAVLEQIPCSDPRYAMLECLDDDQEWLWLSSGYEGLTHLRAASHLLQGYASYMGESHDVAFTSLRSAAELKAYRKTRQDIFDGEAEPSAVPREQVRLMQGNNLAKTMGVWVAAHERLS